ncbi:uncharacterized protein [Venturia canescens]|uniref:uncharacterized protein isoform X2 n=1 Tax=Venturia canescens TaxID=32260 RepID=UPI001C9BDF9B|nr:uncharacterized protein LOC122418884 isoform X2 [Venturia canescens]
MLQDAEEKIASLASGVSRPQTCKISKPSTSSAKIAHKQKKKIVLEDSYTTTEGESDDEPEDSSHNKSSESDRESIENETNNNLEMKNEKNEGFVHGKKKKSENEGNEPAQADFGLSDSNDLFGKDWSGDKMVKLVDQVYCKDSELKPALAMASQASHLARRLIVGVFKPSGYLNCTFTGQAARAHQNKPGNNQLVKPLNEIAKNEILNFAMMRAEKKGWKNKDGLPQTEKEIRHAMSQKIGELKRKHEANEKIAQKNKS